MERLETSGLAESLSFIYKAFIDDMYMRKILFSFSKSRAIFTPLPMLLRDSLCWTNAPTPPYRRPYSQILSVVKERTQDSCFSSRCTKRCSHPKKPSYSYNAAALTSSISLTTTSLRIYQSSVSLKIHTRLLRLGSCIRGGLSTPKVVVVIGVRKLCRSRSSYPTIAFSHCGFLGESQPFGGQ